MKYSHIDKFERRSNFKRELKSPMKKSFRQQRYLEKQKLILENAAELFAEKGFDRVSLEEIGARIKLSKASLYHYVKSKEDIIVQLQVRALDQAIEVLEAALESDLPTLEKLQKAVRALIAIATQKDIIAYYRVEPRLVPGKKIPHVIEKRDRILECVHRLVKEGVDSGLVSTKNWRISAFAALGALNWIPLWYSHEGELAVDEVADAMEEFIFRGFGIPINK